MHVVVDVTADPTTGTPVFNNGDSEDVEVRWPNGFTAWRDGNEVAVLDGSRRVVMRTGARYWICPQTLSGWVVGMVKPCPDCPLGFEVD
jgi:hypothetical protein